jgi:murein DD-endopeptidase MepM/ murein hydrolase activator NlpD
VNRLRSIIFIMLLLAASAAQAPAGPVVTLSSERVVAGTTLAVRIESDNRLSELTLRFGDRRSLLFHPSDNTSNHRLGLVAVPFRSKTGPRALSVRWKDSGQLRQHLMAFQVTRGNYRSENLKVDPARVHPSKQDRERAAREQVEVQRIYASGHASPFWRAGFQRPMESAVTSPFGNRRLFNGKLASYHGGMDFRASVGTPVKAANRGIVKLAKNLFYAGNTILIDHGAGVFTIYAHLSQFGVSEDQRVKKGQVIGWSGQSGRVSGPHLHWGVKLNGQNVNPLQFMETISKLFGRRPPE